MIDSSKKTTRPSALYVYQQTLGLLMAGSQQAPMVGPHTCQSQSMSDLLDLADPG